MPDVFANYPFLNVAEGTLTFGSFLGATTEAGFMSHIWKLRRWALYGVVTLETALDVFEVLNLPTPDESGYIMNGENSYPGEETDEFSDVDDILTTWRRTRNYAAGVIIDEESGEKSATRDIWWGPIGTYGETSGLLDSSFYVEKFPNGDESFQLASDPFLFVDEPRLSDAFLTFDPDGDNVTVPLYETDDPTYSFQGEFILIPGGLYWDWIINGEATYNTSTGAQIRDPLRLDANGSPRIYCCQQA